MIRERYGPLGWFGMVFFEVFMLLIALISWRPPADVHIAATHLERHMRAETVKLPTLLERFKAFIARRKEHAETVGDGYLPEGMFVGT